MTFVDTNVLLDVITGDPAWVDWSVAHLDNTRLHGPLFINDIVFAELAVRYETTHEVEALLAGMRLVHVPIPRDALFLAAKAFQRYKAAGGTRSGVLPDFFIGAHAQVAGERLLTRDRRRYTTYFPRLQLIAPESRG